jgi:hypothetical protein
MDLRNHMDYNASIISPALIDLKFTVSLDASFFSRNVHYICSYLYSHNLLWKESVCRQCIGQALRQHIVVKANLLNPQNNSGDNSREDGDKGSRRSTNKRSAPPASFDGNIIYSQYLYSSVDLASDSPVCIVGLIPMASFIALLLMNPTRAVVYVSHNDPTSNPFYNDLFELQSLFENFHISYSRGSGVPYECTVLHIFGMVNNLKEVAVILQQMPRSHALQHIIWEKFYSPIENYFDETVRFNSTSSSANDAEEKVVEFDSVGHWFGGRTYHHYSSSRNDEDDHTYVVQCFIAPKYSMVKSQPMQVLMGTVKSVSDYNHGSCEHSPLNTTTTTTMMMEDMVYFITYEQHTFIETAEAMAGALHRAGFPNALVMGSFNRTTYLRLRQEFCRRNLFQIVIGGHDPHVITGRYILLHTENINNAYIKMSHYRHILQHASAVMVYSKAHFNDVVKLGRGAEGGIFLVPMYSSTTGTLPHSESDVRYRREHGDFSNDLLVLLSWSERRRFMYHRLLQQTSLDNISIITTNWTITENQKIEFMDTQTREFFSDKSKIFFNFHSSDDSVLETHRINNLLSLGVCIVSEYSRTDPDLDAEYADTIYFHSTFEGIYAMVKMLLADEAMLRNCYKKSLDKFSRLMMDTDGLVAAITYAYNDKNAYK